MARALLDDKRFDYPDRRVHLRFFRAEIAPGEEPRSLEADAPLRWASAKELLSLPSPDANRELVARLAALDGPSGIEGASVAVWALWGLPVAFVLAAATWMAGETIARLRGIDLERFLEKGIPFPLVIGGMRATVLASFVIYEAIIVIIALRRRRLS